MIGGVAVVFFKFAQQFAGDRVARRGQIDRFRHVATQFVKHASPQADGSFRHADKQHRACIRNRKLLGQLPVNRSHNARRDRNMSAQHFADK